MVNKKQKKCHSRVSAGNSYIFAVFSAFFLFVLFVSGDAFAQTTTFANVTANITGSIANLPGLLSAIAYILGLALGLIGVLQVKEHVENPGQKPLKDGLIRLVGGGALLALPMLTEVMSTAFGNTGAGVGLFSFNTMMDASDMDNTFGLAPGGGIQVNHVIQTMVGSLQNLPGLISAFSYIFAIFLAISGILKIRDYVTNPQQNSLGTGLIRLVIGGALFSLPMLLEAVQNLFGATPLDVEVSDKTSISSGITNIFNAISSFGGLVPDLNNLLATFMKSIDQVPGLIAGAAYILGLGITVLGAIKIKDHVENPQQVPLKEGIINLIVGGALITLPTVYNAMFVLAGGEAADAGLLASISNLLGGVDLFASTYAGTVCNPIDNTASAAAEILKVIGFGNGGADPTLGGLICGIMGHSGALAAFINGIAYLMGLIFGFWGVFKLRDHVLNPQQVRLHEGVSRLVAGGMFFSFPFIIELVKGTIGSTYVAAMSTSPVTGYNDGTASLLSNIAATALGWVGLGGLGGLFGGGGGGGVTACSSGAGGSGLSALGNALGALGNTIGGWFGGGGGGGGLGGLFGGGGGGGGTPASPSVGLDCMIVLFVNDIMGPIHVLLNFFAFIAGSILIFIGISRLIRSAQDGPRGPGGIGTIMTFVVGGALISYNELMFASGSTIFGAGQTATNATLNYTQGLPNSPEVQSAHMTVTAILKFVIILGLISFVRGLFIIRGVAEGNQQASMMAGVTHVIAGAVAVNLGPLINAVQTTLGITAYGITFS